MKSSGRRRFGAEFPHELRALQLAREATEWMEIPTVTMSWWDPNHPWVVVWKSVFSH